MVSEAQKMANKNYRKKSKFITLEFHESELDLYDFVCRQGAKRTYLKDLIRADMQKKEPV